MAATAFECLREAIAESQGDLFRRATVMLSVVDAEDLMSEISAWRDWIDKPHKDERWHEVLRHLPEEFQHIANPCGLGRAGLSW